MPLRDGRHATRGIGPFTALSALALMVCVAGLAWIAAQAPGTLDIYFIDVEGGQATLYVSPSGQSMLVDAGYPGFDGRDASRIVAAAKQAGLQRIDYLVVTHYHGDHVGGVPELAARMPIRTFVDHGPTSERGDRADAIMRPYLQARSSGTHLEVKAGDRIPVDGLDVRVVASNGALLSVPLDGGGQPNPLCANFTPMKDETSEDAYSVGAVTAYGRFRIVHLGDLSWNQEYGLVCPSNRIGPVSVLLATQHGDEETGSPAFVYALRPNAVVASNGPKKSVVGPLVRTVRAAPRPMDLWQLHQSFLGEQLNVAEPFIANLGETDGGHWLKVAARADGSFSVTNGRTGETKAYTPGD
jgi:beta-lactamase superfamily II metal-dependent hydrolase